ncbi:ShlB/FhaC/HecB family hemolysin secretion/activation protein [Prosthecobacter dejongeii]|uniref:Hemolysin activation/secretion protein n=1 Tax=Prosthecobacter dejongeii TaxID=48465 RepID=A0A7W7YH00_9BACT|nr:ShlB/FhaC/HecB family hemolysin secretion/activation protein [Prosthecobacter dejongeii]MBB5035832.1 hemolysin activation/secretion protein [Prosthecobacter dejongeii]
MTNRALSTTPFPFLLLWGYWVLAIFGAWSFASGQASSSAEPEGAEQDTARTLYVQEYRVVGAQKLDRRAVEKAVYPYLGPERTPEDVDQARAALEKAYRDQGYQTVSVLIPQQKVKKGVIILEVVEATVGRLRVHGSRYYDIERLKKKAPSLAEGTVPNFKDVSRDIVALNRQPGLRVTPALRAGLIPGTVDIDLNVEDERPFHGSLEVNNFYAQNTSPWRLSGSLSYNNLWQLGHIIGASFQIAPERLDDSEVYSGYYVAPIPGWDDWTLTLQGSVQNSLVAAQTDATSIGIGDVIGFRLNANLPQGDGFVHSVSFGLDRKSFASSLIIADIPFDPPITYYPISLEYSANWLEKKHSTSFNGGFHFSLPGTANEEDFANKRFNADAGFFYFRGDLSHTHDLAGGLQAFGKLQGQYSPVPLIVNEQFSAGGVGTVRGYLQPAVVSDNGAAATFELRSPSLLKAQDEGKNEWRFHVFLDAGYLTVNDPLPEQTSHFSLASAGAGTRFRVFDHFSGSLDAGIPLIQQGVTDVGEVLFSIRFMADF